MNRDARAGCVPLFLRKNGNPVATFVTEHGRGMAAGVYLEVQKKEHWVITINLQYAITMFCVAETQRVTEPMLTSDNIQYI